MKLDERMQELIAIGASITANCQPCLSYHTDKAREFGADNEAIAKAIEIGTLVRKGAQAKMDRFAAECKGESQPTACCKPQSDPDCACC
jgi:AhpD family alkylhydroperoxidase